MKSLRFVLLLLIVSGFVYSPGPKGEILWHKRSALTWKDFKKVKSRKGKFKALTSSGIRSNSGFVGDKLELTVDCYFIKGESWVMTGHLKDQLLQHEQGHFDITEVFARKLRRRYSKLDLTRYTFDEKRDPKRLQKIYDDTYKGLDEWQNLYDHQTNHGIDSAKQRGWDEKINKELESLVDFAR